MAATLLLSSSGRADGGRKIAKNSVSKEKTEAVKDVSVIYCLSPNSTCFISPTGACVSCLFQHAKLFVLRKMLSGGDGGQSLVYT